MKLLADTECHLTLFIRYAKDEIPDEIDGDDNLDNEPAQKPNRKATDVVEASSLNYTVLRPGYLSEGDEDDALFSPSRAKRRRAIPRRFRRWRNLRCG